jgi:predicted RNase H-like HicB family nuclease
MYHFPIIIEECEEGGYYGECPQLSGCHVQGESYEETMKELKAAIAGMIEDYIETGDPLHH